MPLSAPGGLPRHARQAALSPAPPPLARAITVGWTRPAFLVARRPSRLALCDAEQLLVQIRLHGANVLVWMGGGRRGPPSLLDRRSPLRSPIT